MNEQRFCLSQFWRNFLVAIIGFSLLFARGFDAIGKV
ncbi:MAG: hypothetical protein RL278_693, partial [Actinomycetota bacterium]